MYFPGATVVHAGGKSSIHAYQQVTGGVSRQRIPSVPQARALAASSPDALFGGLDASASTKSAAVTASTQEEWQRPEAGRVTL